MMNSLEGGSHFLNGPTIESLKRIQAMSILSTHISSENNASCYTPDSLLDTDMIIARAMYSFADAIEPGRYRKPFRRLY